MAMNNLIALLAERSAEQAILDVLLDHHALKFSRVDLLQEEVLRVRSARSFTKQYLNKALPGQLLVYRVLDSRKENFNLPKVYQKKIMTVENFYTRPEIEILRIIYHGDYKRFKNHGGKASD